ncbi:DAPG hydrolase family protein [Brachyspira sp. SAP_772]|uniref:DAPG hydrolase family protein n=1 Tax=Brachyspira sp. SAP_772 TaxID=2608385 RepID=UPI0012F4A0B4|nr:phloretin hydrolase [Brachyspira sp. SAP_772]
MSKKVAVTKEEKSLPYYKYFEKELAEIPTEKLEILNNGQPNNLKAIPFDEKNTYLAGKDDNFCQIGYGIQDDGTGYVCNTTYMPNVTSDMLDWWFAWHCVGSDLRYKIWDPEDHYFAKADNADYVCNPNIPMNEKTWGVNHYVLEDIGMGPEELKLCFKSPKDFGYDESIVRTEFCSSMVCAIGEGGCPAAMTHKWYPYKDGVMLCSRFWIGFGVVDGKIVKILPENESVPYFITKALFAHNIKEFTNLAEILPSVYLENKDNL